MFLRLLRRLGLAAAPLSTLLAGTAMAGGAPSEAQLRAARALFIAAENDEDADRWSDALEKLQQVAEVKLTAGVRYHTALCEEHLGRLVAALSDYKAAASAAHAERASDVLRLVDRRIADSTERIPNVVIVIRPTSPEATVSLDGQPIVAGVPISADPGVHTIDARGQGCAPFTTTVTLQERDATRVEVNLEPIAPPDALPPAPTVTETRERPIPAAKNAAASRDRTIAILAAAGAVGIAAGGLGAYLAASHEHSDAVLQCAQVVSSRADACDSRKNAVRAWDWVGGGAWAGGAAAATVAIVWFVRSVHEASHPDGDRSGPPVSPSARVIVGPTSIGLDGAF